MSKCFVSHVSLSLSFVLSAPSILCAELAPHIVDRIERSLKGKVIASAPVSSSAVRCHEEHRMIDMGQRNMPVVAEKCLMEDGTWQTGTDYNIQFLSKTGKIMLLRVNPDTGKLEYIN